MIVVSGGLVLVAIGFLIFGLFSEGLVPVYISIAVSIVAGVFLLLGALQRRNEEQPQAGAPAPDAGSDALERVGAVSVGRASAAAEAPAPSLVDGYTDEEYADEFGPQVAVVPGRPRYHVETCRFLASREDVEYVPVDAAREQGYTACGVCKPDVMVEAALAAQAEPDEEETISYADAVAEMDAEPEPEPEPVAAAPAKRTRAARTTKAAGAVAEAVPVEEAAASAAAAAKPAKAASTRAQVVVIPDRDKFHTPACRFVRDVAGTITVSKATAKRQGYNPCGVCKP